MWQGSLFLWAEVRGLVAVWLTLCRCCFWNPGMERSSSSSLCRLLCLRPGCLESLGSLTSTAVIHLKQDIRFKLSYSFKLRKPSALRSKGGKQGHSRFSLEWQQQPELAKRKPKQSRGIFQFFYLYFKAIFSHFTYQSQFLVPLLLSPPRSFHSSPQSTP